jgi:hypothetical protein
MSRNRFAQKLRRAARANLLNPIGMPAADVEAFVAGDETRLVPAIERQKTDVAICHALARDAAVSLAVLVHAGPNVACRAEAWAKARECLKAALEIAEREHAAMLGEPLRVVRAT